MKLIHSIGITLIALLTSLSAFGQTAQSNILALEVTTNGVTEYINWDQTQPLNLPNSDVKITGGDVEIANDLSVRNLEVAATGSVSFSGNINASGSVSMGTAPDTTTNYGSSITISGGTYATATNTVIGGTLALGNSNPISGSGNIILAGGTFNTGGVTESLGTLTLTSNSTIDLGSGNSIVEFSDNMSSGYILQVYNWTGATSTTSDALLFTDTSSSINWSQINFYSDTGVTSLSSAAVVKSGTGTLTTNGSNASTGTTTISAGSLFGSGTIFTSPLSTAPASPVKTWLETRYQSIAKQPVASTYSALKQSDPDGNGLSNLVEYGLGVNAQTGEGAVHPYTRVVPVASDVADAPPSASSYMEYHFTRRANVTGLSVGVEYLDGQTWKPVTEPVEVLSSTTITGAETRESCVVRVPFNGASILMMRLAVSEVL